MYKMLKKSYLGLRMLRTDTYPLDEDQGSEVHVFVSQK